MIVLLAALAAAATAAPVARDPAAVRPGTYRVDPAHSHVAFGVAHLGISEFAGRSGAIAGTLRLDPAHPEASTLDIEIPTASVDTPSAQLNAVLQTPAWLDGAAFPTIRFHVTRVAVTSPGHADADGELSLHGVTRPLRLAVRFTGAAANPRSGDDTIGFAATGSFDRSSFGIGVPGPSVGDAITLSIAVELVRDK